ncbi:MAG TPA: RNase adapter RapZ, partial [Chitinophagales bacterium]|nr:RNase adapter RapZ [Chitinophagales bacterium]
LETKSRIKEFLENAYKLVDVNVQDYLDRNFSSLQINFGCTGGQHRSVYCAEKMADYLRKTYKVNVTVKHIEREYNGQYI